jgi:hypothetical protein
MSITSHLEISKRTDFTKIINELGFKKGVEVGVARGEFSEYLLQNSNLDILYSVDSWSVDAKLTEAYRTRRLNKQVDENYLESKRALSRFGSRSVIIKDISKNAVKTFEDESLDFVYLDASHRFVGIATDLINWWEKLRWGGLFAGHDFVENWHNTYQVCYAVNGFCMEHKQFYYLTVLDNGINRSAIFPSWWLIKTKRNKEIWVNEFKEYKGIIRDQSIILNKKMKWQDVRTNIMYECHE